MSTSAKPAPSAVAEVVAAPIDAVNAYLRAFYSGDFEGARDVVCDEFAFHGPFLQVEGKEAFFSGAEGLRSFVAEHRVLRQWADGDDVSSLYEVSLHSPAGQGEVMMSEWHTVRDGRIVKGANRLRAFGRR